MKATINDFVISDDKELIQIETVQRLLSSSYWAAQRPIETIEKSIQNSICFGIYHGPNQVGFARVVTDYATVFWLADVMIDKNYRAFGLGKRLIEIITSDSRLTGLKGILATADAHELYKKYGFVTEDGKYMTRLPLD